ncbi:hypothetical protein [Streptomyces yanii]|uniref:hypothetical protein n=1 Tax=Streptomyces yanii TaxID=78510 RepID=UPI0031EA100F
MLAAIGAGTAAAALSGCGTGTSTADSAGGAAEGEITLLTPIYEGADGKTLLEKEILGGFRKKYRGRQGERGLHHIRPAQREDHHRFSRAVCCPTC